MIDAATLTAGHACVVDAGHAVYPGAVRVGVLGRDTHFVYACPGQCARQVDALVMERPDSADRLETPRPGRSAVPAPSAPGSSEVTYGR